VTNEEIANVYLFLDIAIKNLLFDMKCVCDGPIKIKGHYVQYIECLLSKARAEMRDIKKEMYQRKIQVVYIGEDHMFTKYKFILAGYEYEHSYLKSVIKQNVEHVINNL